MNSLRRSALPSIVLVFALAACGSPHAEGVDLETEQRLRSLPTPPEHVRGETLFVAHCAACHGDRALGTGVGPPLVHIVYEPRHHSDAAFQIAVAQGVRAHHWRYGDMPPVPGLTPEDVAEITAYIRWLQREAGIY
jgi:cytochrome c